MPCKIPSTAETTRHAGGGEDDRLTRCKVFRAVDAMGVGDPHALDALFEFRRVDHKPAQHLAVKTAHRSRRDHALRRAANAHDRMNARPANGDGYTRRQVAIADQSNAGTRFANLPDQLLVTRPVQDDDGEVVHVAVECACDALQVFRHRQVKVDLAPAGRADDDLFHVAVGGVQETALLRCGQNGERARRARGAKVRPLKGVHRDIDCAELSFIPRSRADLLTDIEHRRFVALALADHDRAVNRKILKRRAHGFGGDAVGFLAVAIAHRAGGRDGRFFDHAYEL